MTRHWIVKRRAQRDVAALSKHLSHDSLAVAYRFIEAFEETVRSLAEMPMGGLWETDNLRYRDLRIWPVSGFPNHLIFYRGKVNRIEIVRVLHGARDLKKFFGQQ